MGVRYTGLGCIMRLDIGATYDLANDVHNPQEELYQYMLLTGNEFDIYNINAFPHLHTAITGISTYVCIDTY